MRSEYGLAMSEGATTGALLGLAGGPFAPLTSSVGAIGGALLGLTSALAKNWFDQKNAAEKLAEVTKLYPDVNKNNSDQDKVTTKAKEESVDDFILRPGQSPIKFNKDDLLIGGTNLEGSGGSGNSNNNNNSGNSSNVEKLLEKLLAAVEQGGDVYIDGNKVGKSLALSTSRLG